MNSNMPKDSGFDKTLSALKEGYEFVMNRDKEMHTNIFETRILGEKTICLTGSELAELFYDNTRFSRSDAAPIEEMRFIKSDNEIELIKESCRWGNLAHKLLQKYTEAGKEEIEVTNRASIDATMAMTQTLGPGYKPHGKTAYAIYRGQIGAESAFPHAVTQNAVFKTGDTLVTGAAADVFGYHSELERVMFVGEYNNDQEKYFKYMYDAQEVAFNAIKPGEKYSSVEEAVQKYYKETGITHLTKHHTGHNIGLLGHEAPFFDLGDDTIMEPGMVVTVEPGIYVKGLGGFRHSDTVLITETGMEMLTYYPRDIDSLIC